MQHVHSPGNFLRSARRRAPGSPVVAGGWGQPPLVRRLLLGRDMKPARGMTLFEVVVVLAVIGIIAALVVPNIKASSRNSHVVGATQEIRTRLGGLRTTAMAEAVDYVAVIVDAPGSDASECGMLNPGSCAQYIVLREPSADWKLNGFDPASPAGSGAATAKLVTRETLDVGVHLDLDAAPPARPAPFAAVVTHDNDLRASCAGRTCFAIRYTARGRVLAVPKDGGTLEKPGLAFVLGSDIDWETRGAIRQELLISFPAGIVKSFAF